MSGGGSVAVVAGLPDQAAATLVESLPRFRARLTEIDGARGFLLITMYVAHCHFAFLGEGIPSRLNYLLFSTYLPDQAPAFFVFLSGFVCDIAYLRPFESGGVSGAGRAVLRRLRWLYLYQIVVTVIVVITARAVDPVPIFGNYHAPAGSPGLLLLGMLTFAVQPKNLDILLLYLVLMLFIPLAYHLLRARRTGRYIAILAGTWLFASIMEQSGFAAGFRFDPLSYGVLFYTGFLLGYSYQRRDGGITAGLLRPSSALLAVTLMLLVALAVWRRTAGATMSADDHLLRIGAFATTLVTCAAVYQIIIPEGGGAVSGWARRVVGTVLRTRLLTLLGESSLFVYSVHVLVVIPVALAVAAAGSTAVLPVTVAGLALIFGLTAVKRRWFPTLP